MEKQDLDLFRLDLGLSYLNIASFTGTYLPVLSPAQD